jgi:hypothetical protein
LVFIYLILIINVTGTILGIHCDRKHMVEISGGGKTSQKHMDKLFSTKEMNGVSLDIREGHHTTNWGSPNGESWFGIPNGNPKFGVKPATIKINDWLRLQHKASSSSSYFGFIESATVSTRESVCELAENDDLSSVPMPVLEIDNESYGIKKSRRQE